MTDDPREPSWAAITVEFIGGSDDKTAGNLLGHLNGWCLRLQCHIPGTAVLRDREIKMLDAAVVKDDVGGISFVEVDDRGEVIGPVEFLDYAAIVALGIYDNMSKVYLIDGDQLAVLQRVKSTLYNEMKRLSADDRRDLANTMDAVLHNVEQYGEITDLAAAAIHEAIAITRQDKKDV